MDCRVKSDRRQLTHEDPHPIPPPFRGREEQAARAVLRVKATGRGSGVEIERQDAIVYVVRDQLIVGIDYYNSKQQALESVGR